MNGPPTGSHDYSAADHCEAQSKSAFVAVLDDAPLTIAKAAKPVRDVLGRVSEESVLAELRGVAPKLAAARKIMQVPVNRQSVVYMSIPYLGRIVPAKRGRQQNK